MQIRVCGGERTSRGCYICFLCGLLVQNPIQMQQMGMIVKCMNRTVEQVKGFIQGEGSLQVFRLNLLSIKS